MRGVRTRHLWRATIALCAVLLPVAAEAGFGGVIETPSHGSTVPQPFTLSGWALNNDNTTSTPGVDAVHIYTCPASNCTELTFWGAATYGLSRPDVASYFGHARYTYSGFSFVVTGRPAGEYLFYAYAHDTVTDQWLPIVIGATVQANVSNPYIGISAPGDGPVTQPFNAVGWAVDTGAPSGTGIDAVNLYACHWHNCNGWIWSDDAVYGISRPDVAAFLGAQFTNSGYQESVNGLPANEYELRTYAHVVMTNGWIMSSVHLYVNLSAPALTIDRQGTGTGGISASGLTCAGGSTTQGLPCGANYALHTVVTLTPQPDPGSTFGGWLGACTGTGTCQVTMSNAKFVSATFSKIPTSIDTTYYHTDVVGSVRAITDATGAVVIRHDYMPFGEDGQPMTGDPMRFAGKELDPETALQYFSARYYRNTWGRFSQVDPIHVGAAMGDPQRWNRYAYAGNNPLKYVDPSGLAYAYTFYVNWDTGGGEFEGDASSFSQMEEHLGQYRLTTAGGWEFGHIFNGEVHVGSYLFYCSSRDMLLPQCGASLPTPGGTNDSNDPSETFVPRSPRDCYSVVVGYDKKCMEGLGLTFDPTGSIGSLTKAAKIGVRTYSALRVLNRGSGRQAHHLIEQRFKDLFKDEPDLLKKATSLSPDEHQAFTNLWRDKIPYGAGTAAATAEQVKAVAREIYVNYPWIIRALGF